MRSTVHGLLDLGEPVVSAEDLTIVPDLEHTLRLEDLQVLDDVVLPRLVLVAIGNEDRGAVPGGGRCCWRH
jgi:hypothetical protein